MVIARNYLKILLLLGAIWAPSAQAHKACSGALSPWSLTDVDIQSIGKSVEKNRFAFVTGRDLIDYKDMLFLDFEMELRRLKTGQHWIDLGAGQANAQIDFIRSLKDNSQIPLLTAIVYKNARWFPAFGTKRKLKFLKGAFENMDISNIPKAKIITDVYGVLSYTKDFKNSLQKTMDLLQVGGSLYLYLDAVQLEFQDYSGNRMTWHSVLKQIPGLESVTVNHGRNENYTRAFKITKLQENIQIPEMRLIAYREDTPPYRRFEILEP